MFFKKTPVRVGTSMITVMLSHTNILADETPVEVEGVGICSEIQDYTKFYVNAISNAELKTPLISGLIQHFIISKWFHHVPTAMLTRSVPPYFSPGFHPGEGRITNMKTG